MTNSKRLPVNLTDEQIDEFGREVDAIYLEQMASRGEADRQYIKRIIRTQRKMALGGRALIYLSLLLLPVFPHALAGWGTTLFVMALGTIILGLAKIIENMEISHNILHAQWDWMKDPDIQSNTWEWDNMSPSDRWIHSHNVVHHTWTNVVGKDLDVGYGILRV
ncbi:MAG: acyl-CoA desaturase, partial [Oleibacter sp.]|nr:acyl-CoA desaturase [Thalassolituus sp.]